MGITIKEKLLSATNPTADLERTSLDESADRKLDELIEYNEQYPEPTEAEYQSLPKVLGHPPYIAYLICLVEFSERASYFGVKHRFGNFIQLPLPEGGNGAGAPAAGTQDNAGALGLGLRVASALTLLLNFLAYLTPLWGGYLSDKTFGRLKTIWYGVWIGAISHIILIIAAIPSVISAGHALAPTIISIITLALGVGFIKPNLLPLLYDQYDHSRDYVSTKDDGKRVIVSRASTLERITLIFYWAINLGAFLSLGTSYCAKRIGFWLAYLIPGIAYIIMIPVLIILGPRLKKEKPSGISVIEETAKVVRYGFKSGWYSRFRKGEFLEFAKPSSITARGDVSDVDAVNKKGKKKISWTDQFVDDVRVTFDACKIFLFFVVYNISDGGIGTIQNSQSNSMTTNGVPNDLIDNFNPLTIIVFIPIQNYIIYPALRKLGIDFRPVYRIFLGFILGALSQVAGAIIQWKVYETSPCGYYATECDVGNGVSPITVWVEVVLYILSALGECFANTAVYEIAYTRAPDNMKGLVMAIYLFMSSLSAAISEAATSALIDPHLIWPFVAVAVAATASALWFLWRYRNLHVIMEEERILKEERVRQNFIEQIRQRNDKNISTNALNGDVVSEKIALEEELTSVHAIESALEIKK